MNGHTFERWIVRCSGSLPYIRASSGSVPSRGGCASILRSLPSTRATMRWSGKRRTEPTTPRFCWRWHKRAAGFRTAISIASGNVAQRIDRVLSGRKPDEVPGLWHRAFAVILLLPALVLAAETAGAKLGALDASAKCHHCGCPIRHVQFGTSHRFRQFARPLVSARRSEKGHKWARPRCGYPGRDGSLVRRARDFRNAGWTGLWSRCLRIGP